jgi:integration host factor subunit alpha
MGHKLTKANLLEMITEKNGYTKKQTSDIFEALLEIMKSTLTSGEDILISGFGNYASGTRPNGKAESSNR